MFKDKWKMTCKGGQGGNGAVGYTFTKKALGGNGGRGGSIFIQGSKDVIDLSLLQSLYLGMEGGHGTTDGKNGLYGKDLYIQVPLVTEVYLMPVEYYMGTIDKENQILEIVQGGKGGTGNKSCRYNTDYDRRRGEKGQNIEIRLKYLVTADLAFVGDTNEGKTYLFNLLTSMKCKSEPYLYTTKEPFFVNFIHQFCSFKILDISSLIFKTLNFDHLLYVKKIIQVLDISNLEKIEERYHSVQSKLAQEVGKEVNMIVFNKSKKGMTEKSLFSFLKMINHKEHIPYCIVEEGSTDINQILPIINSKED